MYSIKSYGDMIADHVRTDACVQALRQTVKPGSVVVDIGTGAGIFAILACKFGARKVYAIEPDEVIHLARRIAADNGCASCIEFIQGLSSQVSLPERADVIIGDLHGRFTLFQQHIASIADARERFLAAGGILIPQSDGLWAALVEAPERYRNYADPWVENLYGLDMRAGAAVAASHIESGRVTPEQLLVPPQCWATLNFSTVVNPNVEARLFWTAERAGTCHGVLAWFDTTTAKDVLIGNGPLSAVRPYSYTPIFFPWSTPVALALGDTVAVDLKANLAGDDYLWRWSTQVLAEGDPGRVKGEFKQSTFMAESLSMAKLRKQAASWTPSLNDEGRIDAFILKLMGDGIELGDIARQLANLYPGRFARWQDALTRVGELSLKYS